MVRWLVSCISYGFELNDIMRGNHRGSDRLTNGEEDIQTRIFVSLSLADLTDHFDGCRIIQQHHLEGLSSVSW
jgi:hypothetical protein